MMNDRKKVLTIAGSDCSGGAGIQADLKTMTALGIYGMSVITAVTVQNTKGVISSAEVDKDIVKAQIDAVCSDIMPDAVKIGMLSSAEIIEAVSDKIKEYKLKNIVLDPVMISTSGRNLLEPEAIDVLKEKLIGHVSVITPNIPEAVALTGLNIEDDIDREKVAAVIGEKYDVCVLIKGGHSDNGADDMLYENKTGKISWLRGEKVETANSHGTGCTLSTAIACGLADGKDMLRAVESAKKYLHGALAAGLDIGHGNGPVDHCYIIKNCFSSD